MTGERKSSDLSSRLNVKRTGKLISKSPKVAASTISSPPKAAIAVSSGKKDDVHRRRNPLNELLRHRSGSAAGSGSKDSSSANEDGTKAASQPLDEAGVRSAELDAALAAAHREQEVLEVELEKLREQRHADEAMIEQLRQEIANTREPIEDASSLASYRNADEILDEDLVVQQNNDLRFRLNHMQKQMITQESLYRESSDRAASWEEAWNELTRRLHSVEKESYERRKQVLSLKSTISSLTRMDYQVTDGELAEIFSQLANRNREWVISNFRRAKLDLTDLPQETVVALQSIVPDYNGVTNIDKFAMCQAVVASVIASILRDPFMVHSTVEGLSAIHQCASTLRKASSKYREWQRATIRAVESSDLQDDFDEAKQRLVNQLASEVERILSSLTAVDLTAHARYTLENILEGAFSLQRTFALQNAQYKLLLDRRTSKQGVSFDQFRMESVDDWDESLDGDGDTRVDRTFLFCVFPGLEKFGDERGEVAEVSNLLLKARVCCGVG